MTILSRSLRPEFCMKGGVQLPPRQWHRAMAKHLGFLIANNLRPTLRMMFWEWPLAVLRNQRLSAIVRWRWFYRRLQRHLVFGWILKASAYLCSVINSRLLRWRNGKIRIPERS